MNVITSQRGNGRSVIGVAIGIVFAVALAAAAGPLRPTDDLITNGGFEDSLNGWSVVANGYGAGSYGGGYGLDPYEGSRYLAFWGQTGSMGGNGAVVSQSVAVHGNATHELTLHVSRHGSSAPVQITVSVVDDGGAGDSLLTQVFSPSPTGTWSQSTLSFVPAADTVLLQFQETSNNSNGTDPTVDAVSMIAYIPEPAGLATGLCVLTTLLLTRPHRKSAVA